MYNGGQQISSRKRTQSRPYALPGRQQSCQRQGERAGHHRGLRAGHAFKGVIRELGRASRLLGSNRRSKGDRRNQHPGICWPTRPADEPTPEQAGRDTKHSASTQGTGRVATRKAQRARLAARPKCSIGTQRVINPVPERLATTGSEFCVVVRNGGTKRKQPASKPCD
jgi:hypothetical protein